jgi:hypothetical protein
MGRPVPAHAAQIVQNAPSSLGDSALVPQKGKQKFGKKSRESKSVY